MNKKITEAFLLSAGLGTRMGELTKNLPKPLIELNGESLISRNLRILKEIGIKKVYVNTFYKAELLENYLKNGDKWGLEIICIREDSLLDTGGGLLNASKFFTTDNILVWNSDVFIDPRFFKTEFEKLLDLFFSTVNSPINILAKNATPVDKTKFSILGVDNKNRLVKFLDTDYREDINSKINDIIFIGISLISKKFITIAEEFSKKHNKKVFSLTKDLFPEILSKKTKSKGSILVSTCNLYWNDVGNPESLFDASKYIECHFSSYANRKKGS